MKTAPTRDLLSEIFVSVTIPVHNEAENIDELCRRLTETLEEQPYPYEIIFIDDGSTDGTVRTLEANREINRKIRVIKLQRNYGQHIALVAGVEYTKGNVIVTLDGDLQNHPEDIPLFITKIEEGYDFVSGWRVKRYDSLLRKIPSFFLNKLICRVTGAKLHDYNCGINAVRKSIIGDMRIHGERRKFLPALMATLAASTCEVKVGHSARAKGKSQYDFFKLVGLMADFVSTFTIKPFRIIGVTGGALFLLSVLFGITYLAARAFGLITPMPKTVVTLFIAFFSGIQFAILGFVGEYLVRIYHLLQQDSLFQVETIIEE
jgi:undecaprenyl-phosphate 4-deoxy-4-formamido-L-arabinose transferase